MRSVVYLLAFMICAALALPAYADYIVVVVRAADEGDEMNESAQELQQQLQAENSGVTVELIELGIGGTDKATTKLRKKLEALTADGTLTGDMVQFHTLGHGTTDHRQIALGWGDYETAAHSKLAKLLKARLSDDGGVFLWHCWTASPGSEGSGEGGGEEEAEGEEEEELEGFAVDLSVMLGKKRTVVGMDCECIFKCVHYYRLVRDPETDETTRQELGNAYCSPCPRRECPGEPCDPEGASGETCDEEHVDFEKHLHVYRDGEELTGDEREAELDKIPWATSDGHLEHVGDVYDRLRESLCNRKK